MKASQLKDIQMQRLDERVGKSSEEMFPSIMAIFDLDESFYKDRKMINKKANNNNNKKKGNNSNNDDNNNKKIKGDDDNDNDNDNDNENDRDGKRTDNNIFNLKIVMYGKPHYYGDHGMNVNYEYEFYIAWHCDEFNKSFEKLKIQLDGDKINYKFDMRDLMSYIKKRRYDYLEKFVYSKKKNASQ
jgi:hypothetical protein